MYKLIACLLSALLMLPAGESAQSRQLEVVFLDAGKSDAIIILTDSGTVLIDAGRNSMGKEIVSEVVKLMIRKRQPVNGSKVLILGLTFKENCPDLRNTRVVDLLAEFQSYGVQVDIHDPWADPVEARNEYGLSLMQDLPKSADYHAVVLAVAHDQYRDIGIETVRALGVRNAVVYDIKGLFDKQDVDARL